MALANFEIEVPTQSKLPHEGFFQDRAPAIRLANCCQTKVIAHGDDYGLQTLTLTIE
jgi:hypothetical protein